MFQNIYWVILSLRKTTQWNIHLLRSLKICVRIFRIYFPSWLKLIVRDLLLMLMALLSFVQVGARKAQLFVWSIWSDNYACSVKQRDILKVNNSLKSQGVYHCQYTIVSIPLSVYNCQYTIVSIPLSVYHCQYTIVGLPLSVYHCQYTIVSTPLSVYHCQYTIVSLSLSVYHCQFTIVSVPLSVYHCQYTIVSLPLSVYHCQYTIVSIPLSVYHCQFTIVSIPLSVYHCQYTIVSPFSYAQVGLVVGLW